MRTQALTYRIEQYTQVILDAHSHSSQGLNNASISLENHKPDEHRRSKATAYTLHPILASCEGPYSPTSLLEPVWVGESFLYKRKPTGVLLRNYMKKLKD